MTDHGAGSRMRLAKSAILSIVLLLVIADSASTALADTSTGHSLQVGAWGDEASKGNKGVQAEIRTHIYTVDQSDFDYFWIGEGLDNGAFIQFGYGLEQGNYCLEGAILKGKLSCSRGAENIGSSDARWLWQYLPDISGDFYYGTGPADSAGLNGTWHRYSIAPSADNMWSFLLDGQIVDSMRVQWTYSKDSPAVVAEKVTSSARFSALGPVEFRNVAFLKEDGWHSVNALYALRGCAANTNCDVDNPYGVSLIEPNHIKAGSGEQKVQSGTVLWIRQVSLKIEAPSPIHVWIDGNDQGAGPFQQLINTGTHTISAPNIVQIDSSTKLRFTGWSDGSTSPDRLVYLDSDLALQANYVSQYLVTIDNGRGASAAAAWYDQGATVEFCVPSTVRAMTGPLGLLGGKWFFKGWYENSTLITTSSNGSLQVDASHVIEAAWEPDYSMPIVVLGASVAVLASVLFLILRRRRGTPKRT